MTAPIGVRIGISQRRARLGLRHFLAAPADSPLEVARGLVALHGTDPTSTFLSIFVRDPLATIEAIEHALYEERALMRLLGMRRTMFVVPRELAAAVHTACGVPVGERSRRTYLKLLADNGVGDAAWLDEVERATELALIELGEATGAQLSTAVPQLRTQVLLSEGKRYESRQSITPWVLFLLSSRGRAMRGRPIGSWSSTQWRWSPVEEGALGDLTAEAAREELARAWLARFGPATVADLRWWAGWTATETKRALAAIKPAEVDLDGAAGIALADDLEPVAAPEPWVALLPALDPTTMGWAARDWYLTEHGRALFDITGNAGPTVWCDGRVVGGWAHRPDGSIGYKLLEDIGNEATSKVDKIAKGIASWLGDARLSPRGRRRAPLEQDIASS